MDLNEPVIHAISGYGLDREGEVSRRFRKLYDTRIAENNPIKINWYGLSRKDEIRRTFKNLVKMISRRANRPSDSPDVNAPAVLPEPIAKVPVPTTHLQDQWTMEQIMAYTR